MSAALAKPTRAVGVDAMPSGMLPSRLPRPVDGCARARTVSAVGAMR